MVLSVSKQITQTRDRIARATIDSVSKHALADLVIDLLRQNAGDENLDGEPLAVAFVKAFTPVAAARGDRPARVWTPR